VCCVGVCSDGVSWGPFVLRWCRRASSIRHRAELPTVHSGVHSGRRNFVRQHDQWQSMFVRNGEVARVHRLPTRDNELQDRRGVLLGLGCSKQGLISPYRAKRPTCVTTSQTCSKSAQTHTKKQLMAFRAGHATQCSCICPFQACRQGAAEESARAPPPRSSLCKQCECWCATNSYRKSRKTKPTRAQATVLHLTSLTPHWTWGSDTYRGLAQPSRVCAA
jgi:hypothetical protein